MLACLKHFSPVKAVILEHVCRRSHTAILESNLSIILKVPLQVLPVKAKGLSQRRVKDRKQKTQRINLVVKRLRNRRSR